MILKFEEFINEDGPFNYGNEHEDQDLIKNYYEAKAAVKIWSENHLHPKEVYQQALDKATAELKRRGIDPDNAAKRLHDLKI